MGDELYDKVLMARAKLRFAEGYDDALQRMADTRKLLDRVLALLDGEEARRLAEERRVAHERATIKALREVASYPQGE